MTAYQMKFTGAVPPRRVTCFSTSGSNRHEWVIFTKRSNLKDEIAWVWSRTSEYHTVIVDISSLWAVLWKVL